jgi:Transposase DDE domain
MSLNKSWHDYSESLIERGRILIDVSFLKSSNKEIKKMNKGKVGAPFQYSDSYVEFLAFLKIGFKNPYRMVQGIVRGLAEYAKIVEEIHFTHIRRRMIKIKPSIVNDNVQMLAVLNESKNVRL